MKHQYISLGAACDTAMSFNNNGLKKESLPFDWLWNLDDGLSAVTEIIKGDFTKIENRNCYQTADHKTFNSKVIVYKEFPTIVHLHTNPLNEDLEHEKLLRRIVRFKKIMNDKSKKHFVYYRSFDEDFFKDNTYTVKNSIDNILVEAESFINVIVGKYPNMWNNFHLLLIIQTNISLSVEANKEIAKIKNYLPNYIDFGYTITRNDEDKKLYLIWKNQWKKCLNRKTQMPLSLKINIMFVDRILRLMKRFLIY